MHSLWFKRTSEWQTCLFVSESTMTKQMGEFNLGGLARFIRRLMPARTQVDKLSFKGVPIKTANWLPDNTSVMVYNGVDNVARLDGTNKEARYEVKKPRMVIVHTGVTPDLAKWRLSQRLNKTRAKIKPSQNAFKSPTKENTA